MMTISVELMSPEYIKWTWVPMIIVNNKRPLPDRSGNGLYSYLKIIHITINAINETK